MIAVILLVTLVVLAMFVTAIWRKPGRLAVPGNVADLRVAAANNWDRSTGYSAKKRHSSIDHRLTRE